VVSAIVHSAVEILQLNEVHGTAGMNQHHFVTPTAIILYCNHYFSSVHVQPHWLLHQQ